MLQLVLFAAVIVAAPYTAFADAAAAAKCQAGLAPEARLIYNTTFPLVTPNTDLRDVLTKQTRSLVLDGKGPTIECARQRKSSRTMFPAAAPMIRQRVLD
jgi:hypothetical protein